MSLSSCGSSRVHTARLPADGRLTHGSLRDAAAPVGDPPPGAAGGAAVAAIDWEGWAKRFIRSCARMPVHGRKQRRSWGSARLR